MAKYRKRKSYKPNVEFLSKDVKTVEDITPAQWRGIIANPWTTGIGGREPIYSVSDWIGMVKQFVKTYGLDQWIVNLLFMMNGIEGVYQEEFIKAIEKERQHNVLENEDVEVS